MRPAQLIAVLLSATFAAATCTCGYVTQNPDDETEEWLFTDALETNFTDIKNIDNNRNWERKEFNVSAKAGRGQFIKAFVEDNVDTRPFEDDDDDGDAGLKLRVSPGDDDDSVLSAELDSERRDFLWGSYRAGMKAPKVAGTCAAFFYYFNDTQEIDMEFLSREFDYDNDIYPLNLVIQTPESKDRGFDARGTGTFKTVNLTFDPTEDFHEYRFDFMPGIVNFYVDSKKVSEMESEKVPSVGGHLILQHWSNGNPNWSGGPPEEAATMTVSYLKAYFNSSSSERLQARVDKCNDIDSDKRKDEICTIPNGTQEESNTGGTFLGGGDTDAAATLGGQIAYSITMASALSLALMYL